MDKKFALEAKKLKNIVLFNPEITPDDNSGLEGSIFIKINSGKLDFEILSFRYLLTGHEQVETSENVEMILPLKRLQDIIKSFSDNIVLTFKIEKENNVSVEAGGVKFKIKMCDQEGRNQVDSTKGEEYKIRKNEFLEQIKRVKIAMGDDEVRYYLNGINLELYKDPNGEYFTRMAATNGHILAVSGIVQENSELVQRKIMPKKVIPEIIKILEKSDEDAFISFNKNKMDLRCGSLEILLKLIEGDFPDFEKIIPNKNDKTVKLNVSLFKDVLGKVSIVSNDKTKNVKLQLRPDMLNMELSSSDGNIANGEIKIEYNNENIDITLNAKYILDILSQISTENVMIKFNDNVSPLILEDDGRELSLFVLMPLRN